MRVAPHPTNPGQRTGLPWPTMRRATITALILLLTAACTSGDNEPAAVNGAPVGIEAGDVATPPTPVPTPTGCTPATPADIQTIEAALTEPGALIDAHTTQLAGYRYVMANVDRPDGTRLTSADIWIFDQAGNLYAGTSSAVDYSTATDADAIPDADRYGNAPEVHALLDCLVASAQQRNLG